MSEEKSTTCFSTDVSMVSKWQDLQFPLIITSFSLSVDIGWNLVNGVPVSSWEGLACNNSLMTKKLTILSI